MELTIRARHLDLTPETVADIRRRLKHAFDRIRPWIRAVDVTIEDINGPKGGADKQCRLRVRSRSIPRVVVEHVGVDALATVTFTADRAVEAVLRKMARKRGFAPSLAL